MNQGSSQALESIFQHGGKILRIFSTTSRPEISYGAESGEQPTLIRRRCAICCIHLRKWKRAISHQGMVPATCGLKSHTGTCNQPTSIYEFSLLCLAQETEVAPTSLLIVVASTKRTYDCSTRPSLIQCYWTVKTLNTTSFIRGHWGLIWLKG